MPFPWAAAAKAIPWSDVIAAAPAIVRSARELLNRSKRAPEPEPPAGDGPQDAPPLAQRADALEARIAALESELASATALIARLAEQNQQLAQSMARLHGRIGTALLLAGTAVFGVICALVLL